MSDLWITFVPDIYLKMLPALSLVAIGWMVEKQVVGRVTTFANGLAINLHVLLLTSPPMWFIWYANIGFIMGIIGIFAYGSRTSLSGTLGKIYYTLSWAYCSIFVGFLILVIH